MKKAKRSADPPGKRRTWWHPLLVRVLNYELSSAYDVQDELPVGQMPLRVDILLIRRASGQVSSEASRDLSVLLPLLNQFTVVEFKAPTDRLRRGDLAKLLGCSLLWHSQQKERISAADMSLVVMAPKMTRVFREELSLLNSKAKRVGTGIFRIEGWPFATWVVETDPIAKEGESVLSMFSRVFLQDRERIIERLMQTDSVSVLYYVFQQIQWFRDQGKEFAMQHAHSEHIVEWEEDLKTSFLRSLPVEDLLRGLAPEERLRGLPPEERLRGLPPEERLRGLPPEERLRGLPPEEIVRSLSPEASKRVRQLLNQQSEQTDG